MSKQCVVPEKGPKAVGPYSPAVVANGMVFVSGQIPLNPQTGDLVLHSFEAQVRQVLENLKTILEASDSSIGQVVKVGIFMTDLSQFSELNDIYAEYFGDGKPARATVQVAGLPKGVAVEMDAIALVG